jgi:DNA-binding beta-propeller fold protein YncE
MRLPSPGLSAVCVLVLIASTVRGQQPKCSPRLAQPSTIVSVPGTPFQALPSVDGCFVFVSMLGEGAGVGVLAVSGNAVTLRHVYPVGSGAGGMAISRDGSLLVVTAQDRILFMDVDRLTRGDSGAVVGAIAGDTPGAGRIYAAISPDDRFLFVADERAFGFTVVDMTKARAKPDNSAIVGRLPSGRAPIAIAFSRDGRYVYTTSQDAPPWAKWPIECRAEGRPQEPANHALGAVIVYDYRRATTRPDSSAVVATVPAGCNPVRLVLNASGEQVFVSSRAGNSLIMFDAARLVTDPANARLWSVPVGTAPVGIAITADGRRAIVTSSNRFAGTEADRQSLTVIDVARFAHGDKAILGTIPAGAFPRELRWHPDARTLILTNFASRTVQFIDMERVVLEPVRR